MTRGTEIYIKYPHTFFLTPLSHTGAEASSTGLLVFDTQGNITSLLQVETRRLDPH